MIAFNSVLCFLYLWLILLIVLATAISPTDKVVFITKMAINKNLQFEVHSNESYWIYWQAYSLKISKHWGQWNRCVYKFDHHWKWLNNWIGEANYVYFIMVLIVNLMTNILILIIVAMLIISFHMGNQNIVSNTNIAYFYNTKNKNFLFTWSYMSSWIMLILSIAKWCFSVYILGFQIFVRSKGLTTYKYVLLKRSKKTK